MTARPITPAPSIKDGNDLGEAMMPAIMFALNAWTPEERIKWWAAFFAYLGGIAAADIGHEAVAAIRQISSELVEKCVRQHEN